MRLTFICSLLFSSVVFAYSFPVLDPNDPEYAWMDSLIERDFSGRGTITKAQIKQAVAQYQKHVRYQHFKVENNRVIGPSEPNSDFHNLLVYLCEAYGLPDLEMIVFALDGLMESPPSPIPIFARCRRIGISNTILLTYGYGLDWVEGQCDRVEDRIKTDNWNSLVEKVHWRGNTTDCENDFGGNYTSSNWISHPRGTLCWLSLRYPDFIDAAFVLYSDFGLYPPEAKVLREQILPTSPKVPYETCLDYKYQILVTGVVSPWSSDWKIHAGRVIFRHPMPWEVYWDPLFKPWEHYIPIARDYSDFIDKITWAREHDQECKEMAMRSREFIQTHARPEQMALYSYKALMRYAKLLDLTERPVEQKKHRKHKKR